MKSSKKTAIILSLVLMLSGCSSTNQQQDGTTVPPTVVDTENNSEYPSDGGGSGITIDGVEITDELVERVLARNFPSYEEIQAEYPDKTVLVLSYEATMYDSIKNIRTREANEYLAEQGYDFVVCLEPANTLMTDERYAYITYIKEKEEVGEQVDLVFNYARFETIGRVEGIYPYSMSVYEGLVEPLDKYLETDTGKALFDLMP